MNTKNVRGPVLVMLAPLLCCGISSSQNQPTIKPPSLPDACSSVFCRHDPAFRLQTSSLGSPSPDNPQESGDGTIKRAVKRFGKDQAGIYSAPFRVRNLKWDALVLAVTAGLIATDRQASRALPNSHPDLSRNLSNASLVGTGAALGGLWIYGMKTHNDHANETGELTLESLANTFTVYTLAQFLAGRERPKEGTGNGRFWIHNGLNSSFPAGHPMFTWAMATVAAHEYPRPWVELLAYGAATTVSVTRYTARLHYPSDVVVGSLFGYLIGTHIFHSHCNALSDACHPHHSTMSKMLAILR